MFTLALMEPVLNELHASFGSNPICDLQGMKDVFDILGTSIYDSLNVFGVAYLTHNTTAAEEYMRV
jgi:hypothetical protein